MGGLPQPHFVPQASCLWAFPPSSPNPQTQPMPGHTGISIASPATEQTYVNSITLQPRT
jgi:hypothetical protein